MVVSRIGAHPFISKPELGKGSQAKGVAQSRLRPTATAAALARPLAPAVAYGQTHDVVITPLALTASSRKRRGRGAR